MINNLDMDLIMTVACLSLTVLQFHRWQEKVILHLH